VSNFDFILYITANQSICPTNTSGSSTIATGLACENEVSQDRPIAGGINFCVGGIRNRDPDFIFAVTKHEILHAIAFSKFLFALWRDPTNNEPRTPRKNGGLPNVGSDG
jgi:leishmanolysin-like peptidase